MGWFKRRKEPKEHKNITKKPSSLGEPIKDDLSDKVNYEIYTGKRETYTIPGVDEVIYSKPRVKDRVKREYSKQSTSYICPKCKTPLENVKKDGVHFYCPNCEIHHHWSKL